MELSDEKQKNKKQNEEYFQHHITIKLVAELMEAFQPENPFLFQWMPIMFSAIAVSNIKLGFTIMSS